MPSRPPTHAQLERAKHPERYSPTYDERRGTSAERGYDGAWVKFRKYIISIRPPVCVWAGCGHAGVDGDGTMHLDHIVPLTEGGARLDPDNVRWLCHHHHSQREGYGRKGVEVPTDA